MKTFRLFLSILAIATVLGGASASAQVTIYDAVSDQSSFTTTGSSPRTYMGQAFNVSGAAGSMPQVTSATVGMFVSGAQTFANVQLRLQIWGTFNAAATGAADAFSNPVGGPSTFLLGPISTTGNSVFLFTLNFATPITLPSTMNLGITFNFQTSTDGVTFADNTNVVTAMRIVGAPPIPVGQNITHGGNTFYRNASGRTDFNFNANDARNITNMTQSNNGLAFSLRAIPEPSTWLLLLGGAGALVGLQRFRRKR